MLSALIDRVKTNWGLLRIFALAMGCIVMSQAIATSSTMAMVFGAFILFQVLTNTGCFSTKGCSVPASPSEDINLNTIVDVEYTELKGK